MTIMSVTRATSGPYSATMMIIFTAQRPLLPTRRQVPKHKLSSLAVIHGIILFVARLYCALVPRTRLPSPEVICRNQEHLAKDHLATNNDYSTKDSCFSQRFKCDDQRPLYGTTNNHHVAAVNDFVSEKKPLCCSFFETLLFQKNSKYNNHVCE